MIDAEPRLYAWLRPGEAVAEPRLHSWLRRPLPRAHLGARPRPVDPVLTRHKHSCMACLPPGGGGDQTDTTSRPPPRCTGARQTSELRRKSATAPPPVVSRRPSHPNTHGDVKRCPPAGPLRRSTQPPHSQHSWEPNPTRALAYEQRPTRRESSGGGNRPHEPTNRPGLRESGTDQMVGSCVWARR